jgi:hypothetical protein
LQQHDTVTRFSHVEYYRDERERPRAVTLYAVIAATGDGRPLFSGTQEQCARFVEIRQERADRRAASPREDRSEYMREYRARSA